MHLQIYHQFFMHLSMLILTVGNMHAADPQPPTIIPRLPRQISFTKGTLRSPVLLINATIPIELRGLIYIADRIKCNSGYFELFPHSPIANDLILVSLLTLLTYKSPKKEAVPDIRRFLQEFGYIYVPTQGPPSITDELKEQYKRLRCMLRIIKILPAAAPHVTHDRYRCLYTKQRIDDSGYPYTEFKAVCPTDRNLRYIPTDQLRRNFKLFTNKAVALTTLKKAKERLASLL